MKSQNINYIVTEFQTRYPTGNIEKLKDMLSKATEDEVYRVANAIDRFGIEVLLECVQRR
jgi:hypothetical protein